MRATLKRRGADVGSSFQAAINSTNNAYAQAERAYITRKAIPGKYLMKRGEQRRGLNIPNVADLPINQKNISGAQLIALTKEQGNPLLLREFVPESKAEPDYGGAVAPSGRAIFYDAKTTQRDRLDLDNLHPHQIYFLECMATTGAISGFLVEFSTHRKVYFLPIQLVRRYCNTTGYKSVPFRFFENHLVKVEAGKGLLIFDYLTAIEKQEELYGRDYNNLVIPKKA
ncbi:MAG: Holliday junction resolvase RecU [Blastocatellia bacterium]|nr:Holliday junction resolvase RecU [Blastocatellia bacterium]MBN8724292.1 Holliday junction resolvase RecU [Acidobacteriota bacterium]